MYDMLIVGAGPAGLFTAYTLSKSNQKYRIAIIDKGKTIDERKCFSIMQGECQECEICAISHGCGGAGMYSDGKLSMYPAGSGLVEIVKDVNKVKRINEKVKKDLLEMCEYVGEEAKQPQICTNNLVDKMASKGLQTKHYDVLHLGSERIQEACRNLENKLKNRNVEFFYQAEVLQFHKKDDYFIIEYEKRAVKNILFSKKLIIATGKATGDLLRKISLPNLNLLHSYNELGVRVEMSKLIMNKLFMYHPDAKIKLQLENSEVRTFCICVGGYITRCYYDSFKKSGKICTLSGYSLINNQSDNTNFALLVRPKVKTKEKNIESRLKIIKEINNNSEKSVITQQLNDFIAGRPSNFQRINGMTINSTLTDLCPGNIKEYLPVDVSDSIIEFFMRLKEVEPELSFDEILLHAPVWEHCIDNVVVDEYFQTGIKGMYVIGDTCGWARGIIQAASSGIIAAEHILKETEEKYEDR